MPLQCLPGAMHINGSFPISGSGYGCTSSVQKTSCADRSRSPPTTLCRTGSNSHSDSPSAMSAHQQSGQISPFQGLPCWSTANVDCDAWLRTHVVDEDVLESFGEIPMRTRRTIVLKAIERPKDNPVAWIAACVTNHRNREMQKRLSAKAQNSGAY